MRARAKTDTTQVSMVRALRAAGYLVQVLATVGGGVPDLLVGCPWGELVLIECKTPRSVATGLVHLTDAQKAWHQEWRRCPILIARSATEALALLGARRA